MFESDEETPTSPQPTQPTQAPATATPTQAPATSVPNVDQQAPGTMPTTQTQQPVGDTEVSTQQVSQPSTQAQTELNGQELPTLDSITSEQLQSMTDEQIGELENRALTENNTAAMQLLDAEYNRRHGIEKTGNALYDATRGMPTTEKGAVQNDSGTRNENGDTGYSRGADSKRESANGASNVSGRNATGVLVEEGRPGNSEQAEGVQEDRGGGLQEEGADTSSNRKPVSEKRSGFGIKDRRSLATGKHFGMREVLRVTKSNKKGVENALKMRTFITKALGKVFNSDAFARRLIAEKSNDIGFLTVMEAIYLSFPFALTWDSNPRAPAASWKNGKPDGIAVLFFLCYDEADEIKGLSAPPDDDRQANRDLSGQRG